jgi:hypothetical protein
MLANKFLKPKNLYRNKGSMKFSSKEYENPFFENKKKFRTNFTLNFELGRRLKIIIYALSLVLVILAASAIYSGYFTIKNIEIKGEGGISTDDIKSIVNKQISGKFLNIFFQKNIFLFNSGRLKKDLETNYVFDSLSINKDLPDTLQIIFKEKAYAFILKEDEKFFYADKEGIVIDEINPLDVSSKAYPIIRNESQNKIQNREIGFNKTYVGFTLQLFSFLKKYPDDFKIDSFLLDNDIDTMKVVLKEGPRIYFNANNDIDTQISKLMILKKEKLKESFVKKEYIDLRYGDSIYYR